MQNKALGATGINLTVANHVLILEPSWNPVFEEQAISRVHRLGQTSPIKVVRYVANSAPPPSAVHCPGKLYPRAAYYMIEIRLKGLWGLVVESFLHLQTRWTRTCAT